MTVYTIPRGATGTSPFQADSIFQVPDSDGLQGDPGPVGTGDFGSVYSNGISVAQAPGAAFVKLVGLFTTNGLAQGGGVTPDAAGDRLVINTTGVYRLWIMVNPRASGGTVFAAEARRNGLAIPQVAGQHVLSVSPLFGSVRGRGSVSLTAGDVIEVYGLASGGATLTYTDAQLYALRLA